MYSEIINQNRILLLCPTVRVISMPDLIFNFQKFFSGFNFDSDSISTALSDLVATGAITSSMAPESLDFQFQRTCELPFRRADAVRVKNMLHFVLDHRWRLPDHIFDKAFKTFSVDFRDCFYREDDNYLTTVAKTFWLDNLVVFGRALCSKNSTSDSEYRKNTSCCPALYKPEDLTLSRFGANTLPPKREPICPIGQKFAQ